MTRKVFRALTASVVEKLFVPQDEATPAGWHETREAALAAFEAAQEAPPPAAEPAPVAEPEHPAKRGPDRHRKGG